MRWTNMIPRSVAAIAWAGIFALLTACTTVDPAVNVDISTVDESNFQTPTTLPKAVAYAEAVRAAYKQRIADQILLQNSVGVGLIGVSTALAGLGIHGVTDELFVALGLAGAGAYTSAQFLASKLQQHIYEAGADAISCSIGAMAPRRASYAYLTELKGLVEGAPQTAVGSLRQDLEQLESVITRLGNIQKIREVQAFVDAEAALALGKAAEVRGRDAIREMETSGGDLLAAVRGIEGKVGRAIIDARPDLSDLKASLGKGIPTAAGQITGRPGLFAPKKVTGKAALEEADQRALDALKPTVEAVVAKARRINVIADKVGERPSAEALQDCEFDVRGAGLTFTLAPSGEVAVDVTQGKEILTINASGGVPPYNAGWLGRTPSQGIVLDVTDSGRGVITITVEKGASAGKFEMLVTDAANGSGTVTIAVASTTETTTTTSSTATSAAEEDPIVKKIQQALVDDGITIVDVGGTDRQLTVDGAWGEITEAAVKLFLTASGILEVDLPTDEAGLIAMAKDLLNIQ